MGTRIFKINKYNKYNKKLLHFQGIKFPLLLFRCNDYYCWFIVWAKMVCNLTSESEFNVKFWCLIVDINWKFLRNFLFDSSHFIIIWRNQVYQNTITIRAKTFSFRARASLGHEKIGMTNDLRCGTMTILHCIKTYYYTWFKTLFSFATLRIIYWIQELPRTTKCD